MKNKKIWNAMLCGILLLTLAGCAALREQLPGTEPTPANAASGNETTSDGISAESTVPTEAPAETTPEAEKPTVDTAPPATEQPLTVTEPATQEETTPPAAEPSQPAPTETKATEPKPSEPPRETTPPETVPVPTEPPTEPPKSAYDAPFDIDAIQSDCVSIGLRMGYTRDTSLTTDNASWWNPVTASPNCQGQQLRQKIESYIRYHTLENLQSYGIDSITSFNICIVNIGGGSYQIYFLFA